MVEENYSSCAQQNVLACVLCFVILAITSGQALEQCSRELIQQSRSPERGQTVKGLGLLQLKRQSAKAFDPTTTPDAIITFAGDKVANKERIRWDATKEVKERRRILKRPQWQKSLRCHGLSQATCEECVEKIDCWSGKVYNRSTHGVVVSSGAWSHFKDVIHVHCGDEEGSQSTVVKFILKKGNLHEGTLTAFWDGLEITEGNGFEMLATKHSLPFVNDFRRVRRLVAKLHFSKPEGHEFVIDFSPQAMDSYVILHDISLFMPEKFAVCEDSKACLSIFRLRTEGEYELRNTNTLQYMCLEDMDPSDICRDWRDCLENTGEGIEEKIHSLLEAALASGEGQEPLLLQDAAETHNSTEDCINPFISDPESWECDCFDDMQKRCLNVSKSQDDPVCLRAQLCESPRICQAWKAAACGGDEVNTTREALRQLSSRQFVEHSLHPWGHIGSLQHASNIELDSTLSTTKSCQ